MSVGQFMLSAALKRQTRSKIDSHVINELRRLGGLQKHLFTEGNGTLSKEYANVLVEITEAIKRIGCQKNLSIIGSKRRIDIMQR